ncbi:hypothetical protein [Youngiibacter multivorans]|uniref:DUF4365 domain-containing protein n=1 Tax=Youngiibacter multivorans TaxID=937251 RepID=A0ABS4G827_9CLOT|nr:hypothetical protein [Youngiibacter multivorans]MBP1920420.1 hypothetical protein [Youngiibacter multivorans]
MNYTKKELYSDFSLFNEELISLNVLNDSEVIEYCQKLMHYLYGHGLACRGYQLYQNDWEMFENDRNRNPQEKTLYELLVYLFIYSREEHMCGGYGRSYTRAFKNRTIPDLVRGITIRLEEMALTENDESDQLGAKGIAGEYFVVAELTRRGFVASLTSKNTKGIDILGSDKRGHQMFAIQVKTSNNEKQLTWKMSKSAERNYSKNLYYVFVNMNNGNQPKYFIVPSSYVAYRVKQDYDEWYITPRKDGMQHKETSMRTFSFVDQDEANQYLDAWYLL